jgi:hypothetical protein
MLHEIGIGYRGRIDRIATGSAFEQPQKRRDEVREHTIDIQSDSHRNHNLGKFIRGVNSDLLAHAVAVC